MDHRVYVQCRYVCMSEGVENVYLWNLCLFLVVKEEDRSLPTPSFITIPFLLYTSYEMCAVPTVTYYLPYLTVHNFSFTFLHQNMSSSVVASYRITSSLVYNINVQFQHPLYLLTYTPMHTGYVNRRIHECQRKKGRFNGLSV